MRDRSFVVASFDVPSQLAVRRGQLQADGQNLAACYPHAVLPATLPGRADDTATGRTVAGGRGVEVAGLVPDVYLGRLSLGYWRLLGKGLCSGQPLVVFG